MSFVIPPSAKSWIDVPEESHFPIQNLPFCSFVSLEDGGYHAGIRIGDQILSLNVMADLDLLPGIDSSAFFNLDTLHGAFGKSEMTELRKTAFSLLRADSPALADQRHIDSALIPVDQVKVLLPMQPRAFVDFYSGINHAGNVGKMFRPDQPPLLPNYRHLPVGYNGRASSVVPDGTNVRRPKGQQKIGEEVVFGPTKELDFELEMGFFTDGGNEMGSPIPIKECGSQILGFVLVNDWSARDMQRWEYVPLGPFLAKSFATSISPWLVLPEALEPFRIQGMPQDPEPFPHLRNPGPAHYDITLEVSLKTARMTKPQIICRSNAKHLYWSFVQQLAHQTSNGTPVEAGDLYASGTISGTDEDSYGSMLELCWKGTKPLTMQETGETRTWLQDGDTLTLSGYCQGDGYRVGFGECSGTVLPSL